VCVCGGGGSGWRPRVGKEGGTQSVNYGRCMWSGRPQPDRGEGTR
jgi:hypothetical protein